jgi:hypothetical protein|tara:strand:+ start:18252 stop:18653 length:402 start_codon:yes stop_codon:yes gene_type:complete
MKQASRSILSRMQRTNIMSNYKPNPTAATSNDATEAVREHLHHDGTSLCNLLEALDEPCGMDALFDLHGEFSKPFPDASTIETALRAIENLLSSQSPAYLDQLARVLNFHASEATRWHGAKVTDLLFRFRQLA